VGCRGLQCVAVTRYAQFSRMLLLHCVALCCSGLQCVAVLNSVLQSVEVCCSRSGCSSQSYVAVAVSYRVFLLNKSCVAVAVGCRVL